MRKRVFTILMSGVIAFVMALPVSADEVSNTIAAEVSETDADQNTDEIDLKEYVSNKTQEKYSDSILSEEGIIGPASSLNEDEYVEDFQSAGIYEDLPITVTCNQTEARKMLSMINGFRTSGDAWYWNSDDTTKTENVKTDALVYDYDLERIALQRAAEVAISFDHTRPDGTTCFSCKYNNASSYGENICAGVSTAEQAFNLWKEENYQYSGQGHRRNMLSGRYTSVGIACVTYRGYQFWVQEFSPLSYNTTDSGANDSETEFQIDLARNMIESAKITSSSGLYLYVGEEADISNLPMVLSLTNEWRTNYVVVPTTAEWSVADTTLAKVENKQITGLKKGETTLSVNWPTTDGSQSLEAEIPFEVRVKAQSIQLSQNNLNMYTCSDPVTLTATVLPDDANDKTVTWKSQDTSIATVSSSGTVTAKSAGTTKIIATAGEGDVEAECSVTVKPVSVMFRLYNPNSGEHFYTSNTTERNNLVNVGWNYEGIGWIAPSVSNKPVYRLYNPNAGDHHYTASAEERDNLVRVGWNYEGIGWYSSDEQLVPVYRQYNPNAIAGSHNYTTSKSENDNLVSIGWRAEGIGWFAVAENMN